MNDKQEQLKTGSGPENMRRKLFTHVLRNGIDRHFVNAIVTTMHHARITAIQL